MQQPHPFFTHCRGAHCIPMTNASAGPACCSVNMCAITFVVCLVGFVASVVILLLQVRDLKYEASQPNQLNTFVIAILRKAWSMGAEKASAPQPEPAHFFWTRCAAPATQSLVLTFPRGARRTPTHPTPTRRTSTCHPFCDFMLSESLCPQCTARNRLLSQPPSALPPPPSLASVLPPQAPLHRDRVCRRAGHLCHLGSPGCVVAG